MKLLTFQVNFFGHLFQELLHGHGGLLQGHELAPDGLRMTTGLSQSQQGVQ